jgi:hypothetical protein
MIITDLDGVMADFATAACVAHDREDTVVDCWDFFKKWDVCGKPMTARQFWSVIHLHGSNFYGKMVKPYPWAIEYFKMLHEADEDIVIMSSPSDSPYGYSGKKRWVDKYLQPHFDWKLNLIVGGDKWRLSKPGVMLIDDYEENLADFREYGGGHTITFPQPWNKLEMMPPGYMEFIRSELIFWTQRKQYPFYE